MKRRDIERALKKAGWIITHGGNHDLAEHPEEIKESTGRGILEDAGLL